MMPDVSPEPSPQPSVDQLLDFSSVDPARLALHPREFDLAECIRETAALFRARARARGIELLVRTDAFLPRSVIGDPERLKQVMANLLGNAIRATKLGQVILDVQVHSVSDRRFHVRFDVADSGIGLNAAERARLFEPIPQDREKKGLPFCYRLVQLMDGSIGVHSTPGQGTIFWFTARMKAAAS